MCIHDHLTILLVFLQAFRQKSIHKHHSLLFRLDMCGVLHRSDIFHIFSLKALNFFFDFFIFHLALEKFLIDKEFAIHMEKNTTRLSYK